MEQKKEVILPEVLKRKLDALGDTPIAEPEIYAMMKEGKKMSDIFKFVAKDLNIKDFKGNITAEFIKAVNKKIIEPKKENGEWKKTPGTENCDLPDFETCENFYLMVIERHNNKTLSQEQKDKMLEEESKIVWEVSGLNKDDLTEWEQSLVEAQLRTFMLNSEMTALGYEVKN